MKYVKWHNNIITRAKERNWSRRTAPIYVEEHHIIPTSVGGNDLAENRVFLTAKEHFIVHLLLTKMYTEPKQKKSLYAAYLYMAGIAQFKEGVGEKRNSRLYESYRLSISEMSKGPNNPMYGKKQSEKQKEAVSFAMKGKKDSPETTEKRRLNGLNRKQTPEAIEKIRQWHLNKVVSEVTKEKNRQARLGKKQTDHQKQRARESLQKEWYVTPPDGEEYKITNLHHFCELHGLDQGNMTNVARGKLKHYKQWKCRRA